MTETQILMNKPVFLGLSKLDLSKTLKRQAYSLRFEFPNKPVFLGLSKLDLSKTLMYEF